MDDRRGDRRRRPGARAYRRALRTLRLARRGRLRRQAAVRDALRIRRTHREESLDRRLAMPNPEPKSASAQGRPGDPCVFVIFGATGDLTKRLLIPSLYNLLANKLLPDKFAIVGVSNVEDEFRRFPQAARRRDRSIRDDQGQARILEMVRPAHLVHVGRLHGSCDVPAPQVGARADRQAARHAGKLSLLHRGVAKFLRRDRQATRWRRDSPKNPTVIGAE